MLRPDAEWVLYFGGPDFAATVGEMGARALQKVWFQKWLVHLVQRPEAGGGVLRQILQGQGGTIQATLNSNVLNSQAVQQSFSKYGDYFLAQAFPDGSPAHPSYPTGHGTVGGACINILKFFFDGSFVLPNPVVPSNDGLSLVPYTGGDAGQITVNGELNKLAHNVTFGHGIHAGIHWRMDCDWSRKSSVSRLRGSRMPGFWTRHALRRPPLFPSSARAPRNKSRMLWRRWP